MHELDLSVDRSAVMASHERRHFCMLLFVGHWVLSKAVSIRGAGPASDRTATVDKTGSNAVSGPLQVLASDAVDQYSAIPRAAANTTVGTGSNASHLLDTGGSTSLEFVPWTEFFGWKMCFPGYATPGCVSRLQMANPWYSSDCPNLQDAAGNTMNIDIQAAQLGGKAGCSSYVGEEISPCAYLCYAHPDYGTAVVPTVLWRNAQAGEGAWAQGMGAQGLSDDRSHEMWEGFHQYQSIGGAANAAVNLGQGSVLEVGAGPWTQTKGLLHKRPDLAVTSFTIFEPLAGWYAQNVKTCSYKTGKLEMFEDPESWLPSLGKRYHEFPVTVIGKGGELLLSHNIQYDALVVMNVIEHVQDAFSFLKGLHRVLKPGGLLIFHERFYASPPGADALLGTGILHPIRLTANVFEAFFSQFNTLFKNTQPTTGMRARNLGEQGYFFVGRKK